MYTIPERPRLHNMITLLFQNPLEFFITAGLLVIALSIHECAHAWTADHLGDPTPRLAGRLTLNPLAHLDPLGTMLILFTGFGWGKPVPFDPFNLRNPKRDAALISVAGPASNFVMAIAGSVLLRLLLSAHTATPLLDDIVIQFIQFNVFLGIFNLIPVHPLDGFKVVAGLLPQKYYHDWLSLQRYGYIFLLILVLPLFGTPPPIYNIIYPLSNALFSLLIPIPAGGVI